MQFTRLRLQGFKSFVDPTEMVIHPGLTGVVGPNGCGKSNLLEALRWVMGENRPTAMRGGGMEDVIFAGAASRPARNHAEVTLILDNSDRLAPAGFNDADTLEIVRRITRDAGSAFKANGREARARDVSMLFADASTGAQSPALVRQGQIAELISAKPKARRRVLEEAAGISGLYQRRHEAELKLRAAEQNLARVDDVLDGLQSQLSTLARQARQAARYRELSEALRRAEGLLLWRRWQEADAERLAAEQALTEAVRAAAAAEGAARRAAAAREAAAGAVPPAREEDAIAGAVLQRLLVARAQLDEREERAQAAIRELEGRIAQLARDAEREAQLDRDAAERIAELEWEDKAIAAAREGEDDALATASEAAETAASRLREEEGALDRLTEDAARLAARHQSADRRLEEARAGEARLSKALEEARAARARLDGERAGAADALADAVRAEEAAGAEAARTEAALTGAEDARAARQDEETAARGTAAEAEGAASALRAEVAALARLLEREAGEAAAILDEIEVAPGYEAALGAALGDELRAPLLAEGAEGSGWRTLGATPAAEALPGAAAPIAPHVTAPGALAARLARIGVVAPEDGPALQAHLAPGQRLVSRAGDLWRWDGYARAAADTPSAAALRLEQQNRLKALRADLAAAEATAAEATAAHTAARAALESAQAAEAEARAARKAAEAAQSEAFRARGRAESAEAALTARLETVTAAETARAAELEEARTARAAAEAARADLEDMGAARAALEARRTQVEEARAAMLAARQHLDQTRREAEGRRSRGQAIARELSGWRSRAETARTRAADLQARVEAARAELAEAEAAPAAIAEERAGMVEQVSAAEARAKAASDALAAAENALREAEAAERAAERAAGDARAERARAEAKAEAARGTAEAAAERIREAQGCAPDALLERLQAEPADVAGAEALETEAARLSRAREALGAVNLRAEEDRAEVEAEHDNLATEKADLEAAIQKLRTGIAGLNREGRQRLLTAFEQVNGNFSTLFRTLFGGGEAKLVLVESDDPLEAGLEIMCQPPGKKLSTLSLLSGGEQTLTALSLIFAVFVANPSPICVLDEVDAPLDDANVTRFCNLLDEMTRRTQTRFLIITHHAVTMSRMDRLFGVTMVEQGVSQLVSVDLAKAEELVDA